MSKHRAEIDKWRATLTEADRFRFNHPHTVLRKWRAATQISADELKAPSAVANLKAANIKLRQKLERAEREISAGGGDLWATDDTPEDIATVMVAKLSLSKVERVARAILKKLNNKKTALPKITTDPKPISKKETLK